MEKKDPAEVCPLAHQSSPPFPLTCMHPSIQPSICPQSNVSIHPFIHPSARQSYQSIQSMIHPSSINPPCFHPPFIPSLCPYIPQLYSATFPSSSPPNFTFNFSYIDLCPSFVLSSIHPSIHTFVHPTVFFSLSLNHQMSII